MRRRRIVYAAIGGAVVLFACVGDDPTTTTPSGVDGGSIGEASAPVDSGGGGDVVEPQLDAALPDAGAQDPCVFPGLSDGGALCDDFAGPDVESFWQKKLSDVGTLEVFADNSAPSPPAALRSKLSLIDAAARAATVSFTGPAGNTSVSCAVAVNPNVGPGTGVRLFQILLRRNAVNARELTAFLDTSEATPMLDVLVTEIGGGTSNVTHAPKKVPISLDWATLDIALKTNHAVASYGGVPVLDLAIAPGDFDDAVIEVGLLSFDPKGTQASSVRYDNLRCRFAPP